MCACSVPVYLPMHLLLAAAGAGGPLLSPSTAPSYMFSWFSTLPGQSGNLSFHVLTVVTASMKNEKKV